MLFLNYLVTWKKNKVLLIEQTIKEFDETAKIIQESSLEFEAILLFNIQQFQLVVIQDVLELLRSFKLLLIKLLGCDFVGWIFKVRSEEFKVLLFSFVVLCFQLFELALFFVKASQYKGCVLAVKVSEDSLRDNLA